MSILLWIAAAFGYTFSCVIVHKIGHGLDLIDEDDESLVVFWPIFLTFVVCVILPIAAMVWVVDNVPKLFRKRSKDVSEVK